MTHSARADHRRSHHP